MPLLALQSAQGAARSPAAPCSRRSGIAPPLGPSPVSAVNENVTFRYLTSWLA